MIASGKGDTLMKTMLRILAVAAVMLICSVPVMASATDSSLTDVQMKKKLILGLDPTFAPMGYTDDNGEIVGFDIDVAREVCLRLGVELVCQPINWEDKEIELNAKNIDCIWNGLSISPERLESMLISVPYMSNAMVLVVRADSGIETKADLEGKKLGLQKGSTADDALAEDRRFKASLGDDNIRYFRSNGDALQALQQGSLDAVLMDLVVAEHYVNTVAGEELALLEEKLMPEEYGIGFRKNDTALADKVNEILFMLDDDGTLERISEKWFGHDLTTVKYFR